MFADSDVMELQSRLTAAELEKNMLADALLAEKKIKLELSEKTDDLNSQLSQQKQLLFESRRRCTCTSSHFISLIRVILFMIHYLSNIMSSFFVSHSFCHHSVGPLASHHAFTNLSSADCCFPSGLHGLVLELHILCFCFCFFSLNLSRLCCWFCYVGDMLSVDRDADAAVEARINLGSLYHCLPIGYIPDSKREIVQQLCVK